MIYEIIRKEVGHKKVTAGVMKGPTILVYRDTDEGEHSDRVDCPANGVKNGRS